ncbi:DNA-directed RNA polymerase subunit beta [Nocardia rhamnosiphila]|uniref:DNA-directed RNA polymerase subunit beta n=1 Tax=Nocardia rhamnosiphila TaxID=426716 RepID=UPI0023E2585E
MNEKAGAHCGDTVTTRCAFYRSCGLAAVVQPETERIVVAAGPHLGAVTMPVELGAAARRSLLGRGVLSGPVISHPRSGRWTFLIAPDILDETPLFAGMFRLNVSVVRSGTIVLPSPSRRSEAFRTWVTQPRVTGTQPSGMALVAAIRECSVGGESRS